MEIIFFAFLAIAGLGGLVFLIISLGLFLISPWMRFMTLILLGAALGSAMGGGLAGAFGLAFGFGLWIILECLFASFKIGKG